MVKYFSLPILAGAFVYMLYENDYQFRENTNTVFTYLSYIGIAALLLAAVYFIAQYIGPAISKLLNEHTERNVKHREMVLRETRLEPTASGMYAVSAAYIHDERLLHAMLATSYQHAREDLQTLVNAPATQALPDVTISLPDRVLLSDYRDNIKSGNFALGVQPNGALLEVPYPQVWHLLNNAQSGMGKSNNIDSFITQVHYLPSRDMDLYLTDYKGELGAVWGRSPMIRAIASGGNIADIEEIIMLLAHEVHSRNETFRHTQERYPNEIIRGYASYRTVTGMPLSMKYLIVDELNALMGSVKGNDKLRSALGQVLQMGRSCGINVLSGAQHLTADVLPKEYYINFATRIQMGTYDASTTSRLLGAQPAKEHIPLISGAPGRALVKVNGIQQPVPIQTLLVTDKDILDSIAYASGSYRVNTEMPIDSISIQNDTLTEDAQNGENGAACQSVKTYANAVNSTFNADIPDYDRKYWYCKVLSEQGMSATEIKKQVWGSVNGRNYATVKAEYDAIIARIEKESA